MVIVRNAVDGSTVVISNQPESQDCRVAYTKWRGHSSCIYAEIGHPGEIYRGEPTKTVTYNHTPQ